MKLRGLLLATALLGATVQWVCNSAEAAPLSWHGGWHAGWARGWHPGGWGWGPGGPGPAAGAIIGRVAPPDGYRDYYGYSYTYGYSYSTAVAAYAPIVPYVYGYAYPRYGYRR